jgi:hypothetical protein
MKKIDFNAKKFMLIQNTQSGEVNSDTVFEFSQKEDLVTADYYGGTIKFGKIIAQLQKDQLEMLYQCLTKENELRAGKATAQISFTPDQKIRLKLRWKWITGDQSSGTSEYIEL